MIELETHTDVNSDPEEAKAARKERCKKARRSSSLSESDSDGEHAKCTPEKRKTRMLPLPIMPESPDIPQKRGIAQKSPGKRNIFNLNTTVLRKSPTAEKLLHTPGKKKLGTFEVSRSRSSSPGVQSPGCRKSPRSRHTVQITETSTEKGEST